MSQRKTTSQILYFNHVLDAAITVLAGLRIAIFLGYIPTHRWYVAGYKQEFLSDRSNDIYQLWSFGKIFWVDAAFALLILCCLIRLFSVLVSAPKIQVMQWGKQQNPIYIRHPDIAHLRAELSRHNGWRKAVWMLWGIPRFLIGSLFLMLAHLVELALISSILLIFGMALLCNYVFEYPLAKVLALPSLLLSKAKKLAKRTPQRKATLTKTAAAQSAAPAARAEAKSEATATSNPNAINVNTASVSELTKINGIGPAIASEIVKYREENGPFASCDQLQSVKGIGAKTVQQIKLDCKTAD